MSTSVPDELLPDAVTVVVAELPEVPALAVIGVVPLKAGTIPPEEGIAPLDDETDVRSAPSAVDTSVEAIVRRATGVNRYKRHYERLNCKVRGSAQPACTEQERSLCSRVQSK
uniref:Uncharacterized protein n=1 Tax=Amphimedon queenslandica TaxID=400682 RepID=A0A1X7T1P5_AMPQE